MMVAKLRDKLGGQSLAGMSVADRMELKAKLLAERMFARRNALLQGMGDRPFRASKMSEEDKATRFREVRSNPQVWGEIFQRSVKVKEDGTVLYPKKLIEDMVAMESKIRKGEF